MHGQINYQDKMLYQFLLNNSACTLCTVHKQYWVADIIIHQSYLLTYIYDYYERYNFTEWSMSINSFLFWEKIKPIIMLFFISYASFPKNFKVRYVVKMVSQ